MNEARSGVGEGATPCEEASAGRDGETNRVVTKRTATVVAIVFLLAQAAALVWPVATLVNDPEVRILGLPLPFAWSVGWVAATFVVMGWLLMVDRLEDTGTG